MTGGDARPACHEPLADHVDVLDRELLWADCGSASRPCGSRSPRATSAGSRTSCGARSHLQSATAAGPSTPSRRATTARDVFLKHILCCFIGEDIGVKLLDKLNTDHICWESDFPHSDSNWPNAPEESAISSPPTGSTSRSNKITHENAMRAYSFDPFKTRAGTAARRGRCGPRPPTSTRSPASGVKPTRATSRSGDALRVARANPSRVEASEADGHLGVAPHRGRPHPLQRALINGPLRPPAEGLLERHTRLLPGQRGADGTRTTEAEMVLDLAPNVEAVGIGEGLPPVSYLKWGILAATALLIYAARNREQVVAHHLPH